MAFQDRGLTQEQLEALAERVEYNTNKTQEFLQVWIDLLTRNSIVRSEQIRESMQKIDELKDENDDLAEDIAEFDEDSATVEEFDEQIQRHKQQQANTVRIMDLHKEVEEAKKQIDLFEEGIQKIRKVAFNPFVLGRILKSFPASNLAEISQIDFPKILNTFYQLEVLNLKHFDLIVQDPQKAQKVADLLTLINTLHISPTDLPGGSVFPLIPFFFNNIVRITSSLEALRAQNSERLTDFQFDDLLREFLAELIKVRMYKGNEALAKEQCKRPDGTYDEAKVAEFTKYIHLFHTDSAANENAKYTAVMKVLVADLRRKEVFADHLDKKFRAEAATVKGEVEAVIYQSVATSTQTSHHIRAENLAKGTGDGYLWYVFSRIGGRPSIFPSATHFSIKLPATLTNLDFCQNAIPLDSTLSRSADGITLTINKRSLLEFIVKHVNDLSEKEFANFLYRDKKAEGALPIFNLMNRQQFISQVMLANRGSVPDSHFAIPPEPAAQQAASAVEAKSPASGEHKEKESDKVEAEAAPPELSRGRRASQALSAADAAETAPKVKPKM